jgi:hypothetical protein
MNVQGNNQIRGAKFYNFALIFKSPHPDMLTRVEDVLQNMGCRVIYRNGPTTKLLFVVTSDMGKSRGEIKFESTKM